jgi:nucleoside-diphosphate-sugar epimerase
MKIRKFIYASSGSVYGVKEELRVTEDLSLTPISTYNKTKMVAERIALSFSEFFDVVILRPATVCGLSRRMRFDVVVNLFVLQAFKSNLIKVTGGDQVRPNIHIDDMVDVYCHFLNKSSGFTGIYNAGFENYSISEIAKKVSIKTNCEVELVESNDPRSYRQDSTKLLSTGFTPTRNVEQAIEDVFEALSSGKLIDNPRWHTVEWMKSNNI